MTFKKVDSNHSKIVKDLRALGFSVRSTAEVGKGFPDIVVGAHGKNFLFEIKATKKEKLTLDEVDFACTWRGQIHTATKTEEILSIIRDIN
jgi:Holliday junction resolvase